MKTNNLVLLLEDDPCQARTITAYLKTKFPGINISRVVSEKKALQSFEKLRVEPIFVVSDVMMPWSIPWSKTELPQDYPESGFRLAGTRCWKSFRKIFVDIPWIYFTVLDGKSFSYESHSDHCTGHVEKDGPGCLDRLHEKIQALLSQVETEEQISQRFQANPKIRGVLLTGFNAQLKDCIRLP